MSIIDSHLQLLEGQAIRTPFEGMTDILLPNYDGYGLANLTPTISHWLGGPKLNTPKLAESLLQGFAPRYKRVVLFLVDALGYNQLIRLMEQREAEFWRQKLHGSQLIPLTSISPSTTATALTTLWTGSMPNQHGIIGYEMWVKQLGMVINTILHTPITYAGDVGGLIRAGFDPATFLGLPPLGSLLKSRGIETHVFTPASIANSGLSQMHHVGSQLHGYASESDLFANLRDLLNARPNNAKFVYAYWSLVDSLMHHYGTYNERVTEQFRSFSDAFERVFLNKLEPWARKDTLILLTADHGSVETPVEAEYDLRNHPDLLNLLVMQPTCESRLPYLYLRTGQEASVRQYFERAWKGKFSLITSQQAQELKLLGHGAPHADLNNRVGDLIVIPRGNAYLWWANKANVMQGRHGGLHPDEMLVPLYALDCA